MLQSLVLGCDSAIGSNEFNLSERVVNHISLDKTRQDKTNFKTRQFLKWCRQQEGCCQHQVSDQNSHENFNARQAGSASAGRPSVCIFYIAQTPFPPSLWHISCDSLTWTRQHEFVGQIVSVQWSKFVWGGCIAGEGAWENWGVINDM